MPSPGYHVSGKEVEVCDSGSWHHPLCGCCNLQLMQSHVAPSHGPPARVLFPLFFLAKSLLLPKPCGKKKHSKTTWSSLLSFRTSWSSSFPSELHGPSYLLQILVALSLSPQNRVVYLSTCFRTVWSLLLWLLHLGFKSQSPSSFAAPFLIPPTVSYT